jgi:uncharacterized small protein (DUF1192 family)
MGWCQAFGPQIRAGCDHSMVAASSSCSCPECGVVCKGKFAGCSAVWAAGPQKVDLRRPTKALGPRATPPTTNNGGLPADRAALPVRAGTGHPIEATGGRVGEQLSAEVRALRRQIEELRQATESGRSTLGAEPLADATLKALSMIETLPQRIARAAGEAMRQQHEVNVRDLREQWSRVAAEAERLREGHAHELRASRSQIDVDTSADRSPALDMSLLMQEFDARFEWLVNELSERFVILGNELVRIEKRLADADYGRAGANGNGQPMRASPLD